MSEIKAILFLANGFEEIEAITTIDLLRRAEINLCIAGVDTKTPIGAHGISVHADIEAPQNTEENFNAVILPGGIPGAENLAQSESVEKHVLKAMQEGALIASICAAPAVALESFGVLAGRKFTCCPGFEKRVKKGQYINSSVVTDNNLITSAGPGTAPRFALKIIEYLISPETANQIARAALMQPI